MVETNNNDMIVCRATTGQIFLIGRIKQYRVENCIRFHKTNLLIQAPDQPELDGEIIPQLLIKKYCTPDL
jgi:hypothetical protein